MDVVAHARGRQVGWSTLDWCGSDGSLGSGEIPFSLSGYDVVTPMGVTFPSWRASGVPLPHYPCVPGETLELVQEATASSSFPSLKVLLGTQCFRVLGAWWDFSGGRSGFGLLRFGRPAGIGICFSFLSLFFFGLA